MKILELERLEMISGGGWFTNLVNTVTGACLGLGAAELIGLAIVPSGYGNAEAGVCLLAGATSIIISNDE